MDSSPDTTTRSRAAVLLGIALVMALGARVEAGPEETSVTAPAVDPALELGGGRGAEIHWIENFEQALEQARILRRPIMTDVWARWCRWCRELDRKTYSDGDVIERARLMTCSKVNADREPLLSQQFGIRGLPTILFFDRHGREIDRVKGFVKPSPFASYMDDVLAASDRTALLAAELREDPDDPIRIYGLADEMLAHGRFAEATPLLASLTPVGPYAGSALEADAVLDLALARQGVGDEAAARDILAVFVDAYPESPRHLEAELHLGRLFLALGEPDEARPHLQTVVARAPGSWKAAEAERLIGLIRPAADRG
jgi:thiol:disulfide interchange protein DsbD